MSSATSKSASETARAINELLHLAEEDQAPLSEVIAEWLDFEERVGDSDRESDYSNDMDDTGIQHKPVWGKYLTKQFKTLKNKPVNTKIKAKKENNKKTNQIQVLKRLDWIHYLSLRNTATTSHWRVRLYFA